MKKLLLILAGLSFGPCSFAMGNTHDETTPPALQTILPQFSEEIAEQFFNLLLQNADTDSSDDKAPVEDINLYNEQAREKIVRHQKRDADVETRKRPKKRRQ